MNNKYYVLTVTIEDKKGIRQTFDLAFISEKKQIRYFRYYSKLKGIIKIEKSTRERV